MKKTIPILIVSILLLLTSCGRVPEDYDFLNSTDDISEISLVNLTFDENTKLIQTQLIVINNKNEFIKDFKKVDCYTYFGDPTGVTPEGDSTTVIKITYKNNDYELINWNGQAEYTLERGFNYYAGFSVFDEEQFNALLNQYLSQK